MRLLAGLLSGKGVEATLHGDKSLSLRPMDRVVEPLRALGAKVSATDGKSPISIFPTTLMGAKINLQISSAQVKSAVLLAGLFADGETEVCEPIKSRDHTERMLKAMGADLREDGTGVTIKKSKLKALDVDVPADISSASYFMALGALKGKKALILGNHDCREAVECLRDYFEDVSDYKEIQDGDQQVILCHYPIFAFHDHYFGACHLYGHVHDSYEWHITENAKGLLRKLYVRDDLIRMTNVGAMIPYMDYQPRTLKELEAYL
jgi:hypothetical protein